MTQYHYPHYTIATVMIVLYMAIVMESLVLYQEYTVMLFTSLSTLYVIMRSCFYISTITDIPC